MTFLNPAILFGLIAAAVPILLHFLNLRKLKRIEFSSIRFLKELQQTKIRRLKFKRILLMVLRVMIIICVVMAFARPTIKTNIPISESSTEKNIIFILDNSFSMNDVENSGSLFNLAKSIIKLLSENISGNNKYYIITTTGDSLFYKSGNSGKIDFPEKITLKETRGNINEALDRAFRITSVDKKFFNEIYLLSDFQKSNFDTTSLRKIIPTEIAGRIKSFVLVDFIPAEIDNRSVTGLQMKNQIIRPGIDITFEAIVFNHSNRDINNQTASLFINGNRRSLKSFDLLSNQSKTISFSSTLADSGFIFVTIEIEEDDISNDNRAYLSFYLPSVIQVNVFSDQPENYLFVKNALDNSGSTNVRTFPISRTNNISVNKSSVNIIFIDNKFVDLEKLVSSGQNTIVFPGENVNAGIYNSVLKTAGLSPSSLQIDANEKYQDILFEHPLLVDLYKNEKERISSPDIFKNMKRTLSVNEIPIIRLSDGSPFLSEVKSESGKMLFCSVSPTLDWSNYPLKSIFAPLVLKSVFYLSSDFSSESITSGQNISLMIDRIPDQLKIISPDNQEEYISNETIVNKKNISFNKTDKAGFYNFLASEKILAAVAANVDPMESENNYYTKDEIITLFENYGLDTKTISRNDDIKTKLEELNLGFEIWKHFVLFAIIFALAEMFVAKNSKNEIININKE